MNAFPHKATISSVRLLGLMLLAVSCGGSDGGGGGDPIGPGSGMVIAAGGVVMNSNFEATILKCELLWDGRVIATTSFADPSPDCGQLIGADTTTKGVHTLAFRIASQTSSPNTYETVGASLQTETSSHQLGDQTKSLTTGESILYSVDVP